MKLNFFESVNVDGAEFIGNGKGFDVFRILTFDAAEQFTIENTADRAGTAYTQSRSTFESNINDAQRLYFIALENTNQVYGAVVKSNSTRGSVNIKGAFESVTVATNFLFENARNNSSTAFVSMPLPLYLIPDAQFDGVDSDGCLVQDNILKGIITHFTDKTVIEKFEVPESVTKIDKKAFRYGVRVNEIILHPNLVDLKPEIFTSINKIYVKAPQKPDLWPDNWNEGKELETIYSENPDDPNASRRKPLLHYKIEGKGVTIKGGSSTIKNLNIPETIEGKPVTKIEAYAFFDSDNLITVSIPDSVMFIGNSAFADCENLVGRVFLNKKCFVGKNAFLHTGVRIIN